MERKRQASESPEYSTDTSSELVINTTESDQLPSPNTHNHIFGQTTIEMNREKKSPRDLEIEISPCSKLLEKPNSSKITGKDISTRTKSQKEKFPNEVGNNESLRIQTNQLHYAQKSDEKCCKAEPNQLEIKTSPSLKSSNRPHFLMKSNEKTSPKFRNKEKETTNKENVFKRIAFVGESPSAELECSSMFYSTGTQNYSLHTRTQSEETCKQNPPIFVKERSSSLKSTNKQYKHASQQHRRNVEKTLKINDSTGISEESINTASSGIQHHLPSYTEKEKFSKGKSRKFERKTQYPTESPKNKYSMNNTSEKISPLTTINKEKEVRRADHNREGHSNELEINDSPRDWPQSSNFRNKSENECRKKLHKKSERKRPYSTDLSKKYQPLLKSVDTLARSTEIKKTQYCEESSSDSESNAGGRASWDINRIDRTKGDNPPCAPNLEKKASSDSATPASFRDPSEPGSSSFFLKKKLNAKDCPKHEAAVKKWSKAIRNHSLKKDWDESSSENDNLIIDEDKCPIDLSDFEPIDKSDALSSPTTLPDDQILAKKMSSLYPNWAKASLNYYPKQVADQKETYYKRKDWKQYQMKHEIKNRNVETLNGSKDDDDQNSDSNEPHKGTNESSDDGSKERKPKSA